ncbi:uncharacterized protein LOC110854549 [Folsomia candida]|uniref:uncharacterized protein LOC110854549 n=1 Tax=Folsomia candida TaxID=158441 RepID=UPI000B909B6B|nr:uncharacterized protein LOC110854549 [Folsomia candida]
MGPGILVALMFSLGTGTATADPQFGGFGAPSIPSVPLSKAASSMPVAGDVMDYTNQLKDLVTLITVALTDMGDIAKSDNAEVGGKIVEILTGQIAKATKIFEDFVAANNPLNRRKRRDVKANGDAALNEESETLVESNDKIEPEKGKLSPSAQDKIDERYRKAINECKTATCKSAAEREKVRALNKSKGK